MSVAALMSQDPFKLLIVDSIMSNFRVDFQGRGELADRQQKLGAMLSKLKKVWEANLHINKCEDQLPLTIK